MPPAALRAATKTEIVEMHSKIEELRIHMIARAHGGAAVQGRWKRHDTARKTFLETVALHALRWGKLPSEYDVRMLFLPPDDEISGADATAMDEWAEQHKKDPRSTSDYGLSPERLKVLLAWVAKNPDKYVLPSPAPSGPPPAYKLRAADGAQEYAGFTLAQLVRDDWRRQLVPEARMPASAKLAFIADSKFVWRFPEHIRLFHALLDLERGGATVRGGSDGRRLVLTAEHARAAYVRCAAARRATLCACACARSTPRLTIVTQVREDGPRVTQRRGGPVGARRREWPCEWRRERRRERWRRGRRRRGRQRRGRRRCGRRRRGRRRRQR